MPFPLIPFVLGAAAGAAITYLLTTRTSERPGATGSGAATTKAPEVPTDASDADTGTAESPPERSD